MKQVITAQDVPLSGELRVSVGTIVTSSAREVAAGRGVRIVEVADDQLSGLGPPGPPVGIGQRPGRLWLEGSAKAADGELGPARARRRRQRRKAGRLPRYRPYG